MTARTAKYTSGLLAEVGELETSEKEKRGEIAYHQQAAQ